MSFLKQCLTRQEVFSIEMRGGGGMRLFSILNSIFLGPLPTGCLRKFAIIRGTVQRCFAV